MAKDWKDRLGVVYSTNPDYKFTHNTDDEPDTLTPDKQNLTVSLDRKKRKGKVVTLVSGFIGTEEDLLKLGKLLKMKCGVGGTVKEGEILIQGDFRTRVVDILKGLNYKVKKSGG